MTEPINPALAGVSLITLSVSLLGPNLGPYFVIVLASVAGGLWAVNGTSLPSRLAGAWLMLRCVFTAIVLTALIAGIAAPWLNVTAPEAYALVAFSIGALGNKWQDIIEAIKNRLASLISTTGGKP